MKCMTPPTGNEHVRQPTVHNSLTTNQHTKRSHEYTTRGTQARKDNNDHKRKQIRLLTNNSTEHAHNTSIHKIEYLK